MFAQAEGGSISTFSTGSASETVTITSGQHAAVGFELSRNTTVTSATFFVTPTTSGHRLEHLEIHANNDGGSGMGLQRHGLRPFRPTNRVCVRKRHGDPLHRPECWCRHQSFSPLVLLPTGASVSSTGYDVGFSPTLTGGYFQTATFTPLTRATSTTTTTRTSPCFPEQPTFRWAIPRHLPTRRCRLQGQHLRQHHRHHLLLMERTCTNATRIMVADVDGDNYDDVVGYALATTSCAFISRTRPRVASSPW